jgi:hypothetical protein
MTTDQADAKLHDWGLEVAVTDPPLRLPTRHCIPAPKMQEWSGSHAAALIFFNISRMAYAARLDSTLESNKPIDFDACVEKTNA